MKKPQEVFLEYITSQYHKELSELKKCNHQNRLQIDYLRFNDYFTNEMDRDFFSFDNYKKILDDVEKQINQDNTNRDWISLKLVDFPPTILLHDLDATHVGDVVSCKAMIKNITEPAPTLRTAVYECKGCMRLIKVNIHDNIITQPTLCPECGSRRFVLSQELSDFRDYRYVKLEEPLELRSGGRSREFKGYMQDYLASPHHNLKAGDIVDIIGEFNVRKSDKNSKKGDFEFYIDLHNINPVNNAFEDYRLTEDDIIEIKQLAQDPHIYERLVASLAPEIVGYHHVKQGLLLQLFEGNRPLDDTFKHDGLERWVSHILLIGDPGIGKSQLISALQKRVPKMIYIDGADTSKAGLTTSAVKDELTGTWTLEAGAIVLADTGVLCIDEFDKLSKSTQKALNQPMEKLTVSPAKANLVQTMSARTSVIACANPKYGRFNPFKSVNEQINIPESTLSRFDLVFALNDSIDVEHDINLATSLLNRNNLEDDGLELIPADLFKKYLTYAKLECFPVLEDSAKNCLVDFYVNTRQCVKDDESAKPITARDLMGLERLTIARAKAELRDVATVDDAEYAIEVYRMALDTIGLTVETRGELENVLSDAEAKLVSDTENIIMARMVELDTNFVNDEVLASVNHEVGLWCHDLGANKENILDIAVKNVKNKIK